MNITAHTELFAVIGAPIGHSLSPVMHNAAFSYLSYDAVYVAFEVSAIDQAIAAMRSLNIKGFSVTIPHKVAVMDHLDEIDDLARKIGAVNIVINRNGRLVGANTDCYGAVTALKTKCALAGKQVAVLGAGGAAKALGFGLQQEGARVIIYNRDHNRGAGLARMLNCAFYPLADFNGRDIDIVVNTTPVGMAPDVLKTPIAETTLNANMLVMDIVYNPLKTALLGSAERKGCPVIDGTFMFVHQGARQFELWTGLRAPVTVMHRSVMARLTPKIEGDR